MLAQTNDAFVSFRNVALPGDGESITLRPTTYDAGSEANNELQAFIPGLMGMDRATDGAEGFVHVHRGLVNSYPESLVTSKFGPHDVRLYESQNHVRNLLDCVRSRAKTVCPVDEAFRSEMLCQVSEIAIRLKRKLNWDPKTERFIGDDAANEMLCRPMRSPWKL